MGCFKSKPKYESIIEYQEDQSSYFMNIYKPSENEYIFSGVLSPDVKKFCLLFKKEDEERLPLAISFHLSEDNIHVHQYQLLRLSLELSLQDINNSTSIQFPEEELSSIYSCQISPSFPYAIDIYGTIPLKSLQ
jgi:hypothetical protein